MAVDWLPPAGDGGGYGSYDGGGYGSYLGKNTFGSLPLLLNRYNYIAIFGSQYCSTAYLKRSLTSTVNFMSLWVMIKNPQNLDLLEAPGWIQGNRWPRTGNSKGLRSVGWLVVWWVVSGCRWSVKDKDIASKMVLACASSNLHSSKVTGRFWNFDYLNWHS